MNEKSHLPKVPFWKSKGRLGVFKAGVLVFAMGAAYTLFVMLAMSGWKETDITSSYAGEYCMDGGNSGHIYKYEYRVDGKDYTYSKCMTGSGTSTVRVITYNPANPNQAQINTYGVNLVLSFIFPVLGVIFMLGAVFLTDPKGDQEARDAMAASGNRT